MSDYDNPTFLALHTTSELQRGAISYEQAELQLQRLQTQVDGAYAVAGMVHSAVNIFAAACGTLHACLELNAMVRTIELQTEQRIQHIDRAAPITEKSIDRLLDNVDRLLDSVMAIDVDTCTDRQLDNREMMVEQLTMFSNQAHAVLIKFLSL